MGKSISPLAAGIAILVIIVVVALAWMKFGAGEAGSKAGEAPAGMPANVTAEIQQRALKAKGEAAPVAPAPSNAPATNP